MNPALTGASLGASLGYIGKTCELLPLRGVWYRTYQTSLVRITRNRTGHEVLNGHEWGAIDKNISILCVSYLLIEGNQSVYTVGLKCGE